MAASLGQALLKERSQKQGFRVLENREHMHSEDGEGVNSGTRQISGGLFETWLHRFLECVLRQVTSSLRQMGTHRGPPNAMA